MEETKTVQDTAVTDAASKPEDLEKALDSALQGLEKSSVAPKLAKAEMSADDDEDEDEGEDDYADYDEDEDGDGEGMDDEDAKYEDEDEDEDEDESAKAFVLKKKMVTKSKQQPDFAMLSKSFPETVSKSKGAHEIIDAAPFVKSMLTAVEKQMIGFLKAIDVSNNKISRLEKSVKNANKLNVVQAKMIKALYAELQAIGSAAQPRKAILSSNAAIIRKSVDGAKQPVELSKATALDKLTALHKSGRVDLTTLVSMEARIQKNLPLPEHVEALLTTADQK